MARILVIEDEPVLCTLMQEALEKAGYEVLTAPDGKKGVELFFKQSCDVVITDILMPEKEGLEIILELTQQFPGIKVIAISGGGVSLGDYLLDVAKEFGAKRALRKPIQMKQLVAVVKEVLDESTDHETIKQRRL
jgi:DNA-binding response OmpR family regulator